MKKETNLYLANVFAVPGTGRRRYGYFPFRAPRCVSIKKAMLGAGIDLRGAKVPPDDGMETNRSSQYDRNWKQYRKTRWHRIASA